ncbi:unnamed protein product [Parnassius mnemosyne]|uniref:Uncharacterized protein n=1 Tax=Parnassius mnemosyne TaxID=213953 RepID=A0AAV1LXW3_9NEOP
MSRILTSIFILALVLELEAKLKKASPPHCTQVAKDTDYVSRFKMDYPIMYLVQGQREAFQQMYCINPSEVNKAVTTVCDWAAPPQVQFTLGDEYMHVVRQDPTGHFLGNAVITTYQLCSHNIPPHSMLNQTLLPIVTKLES